MKNRRGYTLIEMLTVITVTSVLLGIAAFLLHSLFQWQQTGHERLRQRLAMDRLARQFREDVHAASGLTAAEVSAADQKKLPGWRLQLAGSHTIRYWVAGDALARGEREGDKPVAREEYALPPGAKVEIGLPADGKPRWPGCGSWPLASRRPASRRRCCWWKACWAWITGLPCQPAGHPNRRERKSSSHEYTSESSTDGFP